MSSSNLDDALRDLEKQVIDFSLVRQTIKKRKLTFIQKRRENEMYWGITFLLPNLGTCLFNFLFLYI